MFYRGCIAVVAISFMPPVSAFAAESGIHVIMNQAKIVRLARAADTVIVGNPDIADAAIQDASTIVLTGKGFGTTNFVVMDAEGNAIVDEMIRVSRGDANTLRIYRGAEVQTLSCTPYCESAHKTAAEEKADQATAESK
jgi:Flp pilus assembly secretin CpaC